VVEVAAGVIVVVIAITIKRDRGSMLFMGNSPEVSSEMIRPSQVHQIEFQHKRHKRGSEKRK
jgi:hypothetical protein